MRLCSEGLRRLEEDHFLKARLDGYLLPKALRSMVERAANAEALFEETERAPVTLNSVGDAVISIEVGGRVVYLNAVAETMTGWSLHEAAGRLSRVVASAILNTSSSGLPVSWDSGRLAQ